jgi:hypothetical protein
MLCIHSAHVCNTKCVFAPTCVCVQLMSLPARFQQLMCADKLKLFPANQFKTYHGIIDYSLSFLSLGNHQTPVWMAIASNVTVLQPTIAMLLPAHMLARPTNRLTH